MWLLIFSSHSLAPPLFSTVTLSITAVGWGLVLLLGIIIIIVIIVLLINNLKPKNKYATQYFTHNTCLLSSANQRNAC